MKILMTTDTIGGVWTYAIELARALAPAGARVALAAMGGPLSHGQRRQLESLDNVELHESDYKLEWMADPWNDVHAAGDWLLDIARAFKPDLVHLNGYAHGSLPFDAPVLVVGHSCVLSWWAAVKGEPAPPAWDCYRDAVRDGLQAADLVVAPSRAMLAALNKYYGPLPRSRVIANGRDGARYASAAEKEPLILCAGRLWDEAKNVALLADIAPELPWQVCIAGEHRQPLCADAPKPLSGERSTGQEARLLGRLDEAALAEWFGRASVYALPVKYEPFGLSALEAALAGCALVLGDIPSMREVWGDAAVYASPDDPAALRAALLQLINDPAMRNTMARRAFERAGRYTAQHMAAEYVSAYEQLTSISLSPAECRA